MPLVQLLVAIVVEVGATSLLKVSDGFTRLTPTALCLAGYAVAFWLVAQAVRTIPLGFAYAAWSGIGTVLVAVVGAVVYAEGMTAVKAVGIALVVAGVVILNMTATA